MVFLIASRLAPGLDPSEFAASGKTPAVQIAGLEGRGAFPRRHEQEKNLVFLMTTMRKLVSIG
jgi:hypothetical protein